MVTFIFLLVKVWKDTKTLSNSHISRTLLIHCTIYFGLIGIMLSLNMIASVVPQLYVPITESNVVVPISSLTCSQLILSLKRSSQPGETSRTVMVMVVKDEENASP